MRHRLTPPLAALALLSCHADAPPLPTGAATPPTYFTAKLTDRRFHVADHMLASIEMQISGEPFAQLLGRTLTAFDRFQPTPDLSFDPATGQPTVDALGYAAAIESYEYSKQPMNNLSFESSAGLSLQFAPLLNPTGVTGDPAFNLLLDRLQRFADASHAGGKAGQNFVVSPAPTGNPLNYYGWPGYWPEFAEFRAFDPAIEPSTGGTRNCTLVGGYKASSLGATVVGHYECGYNSLHLPLRDQQVDKVLEPAALGFAAWKQALWVINYWQSVHDLAGDGITEVDDADLAHVGEPGNSVVGRYPDPADPSGTTLLRGGPGTYLGDIPLEGWQGLTMLEELDNKAAFLLRRFTVTVGGTGGGDDGALSGFASTKEAIDYDHSRPLRWFPAAVTVTETATAPGPDTADKYFPKPTAFVVTSRASRSRDLAALLGGFAELFALTDADNRDVGGNVASRATFDGDPFPADDGLPDGEETPHDRALAVIKVALVNLDRLHRGGPGGAIVDEATVAGGVAKPGGRVSAVDAAYVIVGLRTAIRALTHELTLYSNDTPDTHDLPSALDGAALRQAPFAGTLTARALTLLRAEADVLADTLVADDGSVASFVDLPSLRDPAPARLVSHAAAIRGLLEAYLATGDERYRQRATRVYARLEQAFWMNDVRAFRTTAGVSDVLTYGPLELGVLSGALRQYWKLVARRPGSERTAAELLERWKRLQKLVVNGWDDANGDDRVQYPDECTGAGLQMAERALTGELSREADLGDRDHDCVKEIAAARLPAALAAEVVLRRR